MTEKIYLDNAATTSLDSAVFEAMLPYLKDHFGNPSSIHAFGRKTKSAIENARKTIASLLNTSPGEIFFTSGGTEADNMAIVQSVKTHGVKHIISSPLEHHAVLHTLEHLAAQNKISLHLLSVNEFGDINLEELENQLSTNKNCMVSLMHGNNEIGNLLDLEKVGALCKEYKAVFHSDTVQTMGHYGFDLKTLNIDFLVGAAHKFHGPKGVGFIYINADKKIEPLLFGGSQERNMRGGTENLYGIIGMAKALELALNQREEHQKYITNLKTTFIEKLKAGIPDITFNGRSAEIENSLYTVLNVSFPANLENDMMLFNLDIEGIACSGGSACSSGTDVGSHVLSALKLNPGRVNVRFSFARTNTIDEINRAADIVIKCAKAS